MTFQLSTKPFVGAQKMHIPCGISNCFRLEDTLRGRTKHPCRIPGLQNDGRCKTVERAVARDSGRTVGPRGARGDVHVPGAHGGATGVGEGAAERPERVHRSGEEVRGYYHSQLFN